MLTKIVNDDFLCSKKIEGIKINSGILEKFAEEFAKESNAKNDNKMKDNAINNAKKCNTHAHIKGIKDIKENLEVKIKENGIREKIETKKKDDLKKSNARDALYNKNNTRGSNSEISANYLMQLMQQGHYQNPLSFTELFSYLGAKPILDIYKGLYSEEKKIEVDFGKENLPYSKVAHIVMTTKLKKYQGQTTKIDFISDEIIDVSTKEKWNLIKNTSYSVVLSFLFYELSLN